jgi:hypothetical protein
MTADGVYGMEIQYLDSSSDVVDKRGNVHLSRVQASSTGGWVGSLTILWSSWNISRRNISIFE